MSTQEIQTERHPLEPFLPEGAKILMLGSFPPKRERWSMDFFYPNFINDMWRITGCIFFGDKNHFIAGASRFDKEKIIRFCTDRGIALYDTACEVRRLKYNASDKFLEVVKATDLEKLLSQIPACTTVVTTGQKATDVIVSTFGCDEPPVGGMTGFTLKTGGHDVPGQREMRFWRMPSSSRAYPLALERKAEYYRTMYRHEGLLE